FGPLGKLRRRNSICCGGCLLETNRVPFAKATSALVTKSEKIRALAKADYSRVEIAALLEIRYQHVRKVLPDSGMVTHLKNVKLETERSTVVVVVGLEWLAS